MVWFEDAIVCFAESLRLVNELIGVLRIHRVPHPLLVNESPCKTEHVAFVPVRECWELSVLWKIVAFCKMLRLAGPRLVRDSAWLFFVARIGQRLPFKIATVTVCVHTIRFLADCRPKKEPEVLRG